MVRAVVLHDRFRKLLGPPGRAGSLGQTDPAAYLAVCESLDVERQETVFLDDVERFAEGAQAAVVAAVVYRDNEPAVTAIERHLAAAERH